MSDTPPRSGVRRPPRLQLPPATQPPKPSEVFGLPPDDPDKIVSYIPAGGSEMLRRLAARYQSAYYTVSRIALDDPRYGTRPIAAFDGGTSRSGRRYQPLWPTYATRFLALRINGLWYFDFLMRPAGGALVHVPANEALSSRNIRSYEAATDYRLDRIRNRWTSAANMLRDALARPATLADGPGDSPAQRVAHVAFQDPLIAYTYRTQHGVASPESLLRSAALSFLLSEADYGRLGYATTAELLRTAVRLRYELETT